jgi:RNA polymerase sigma-70 factor (ECF subfamily)
MPERDDHPVSTDDASLVRRCLRGEDAAISLLVDRFQTDVYGLCIRILHHRQDAEDVCQEVFLRIFRSLDTWDPSRPLRPWILGIAVNRCRTWLSQRQRRPETVDYLQEVAATRPEEDDSFELLGEIHQALATLRDDYRLVFLLFHEQGQSYEEIALAVDRPVGTVKTWLHRARTEILGRLQQRGMIEELPTRGKEQ